MTNDMGRPKNYKLEEIKNVINSYVVYTGGTVLLNASKIAKYANRELGLPNFKYYVINRNLEAKKYLEDLNGRITGASDKKLTITKSVFTQIDVNSYLSMKKDDLKVALSNLNILIEDMANANTELIKENVQLKNRVQEKDIEIRVLNKEITEIHKEYQEGLSDYKEKSNEQKHREQNLYNRVKELDDLFQILWDREAENILKQNGVFENNDGNLNENRVISDVNADIVKNVNNFFTDMEDDKISFKLINKIKNI